MNESIEQILLKVASGEMEAWDACVEFRRRKAEDSRELLLGFARRDFNNPLVEKGYEKCIRVVISDGWRKEVISGYE